MAEVMGAVLESRIGAVVVFRLNRHQCEDRTPGENTRRADRDQVAEQTSDRLRQWQGCPASAYA